MSIRAVSDHTLVLLSTEQRKWDPSTFRFDNIWLEDNGFKGLFKNCWDSEDVDGWEGYRFLSKLKLVKRKSIV